jgi:hypothetical protein
MEGSTVGLDFETTSASAGGGGGTENFVKRCFVCWHFGLVDPSLLFVIEDDRWLVED